MKPGTTSRRGAFASIAFTLGGSLLLLASRLPSTTVRAGAGMALLPQETVCQHFWNTDRDTGPNGQAVGHDGFVDINLYANKNHTTIDLSHATIIGALENTSSSSNSRAYPQLGKHGKGCMFFQRRANSPSAADAWIQPFGSSHTSKLLHALYCKHHPSDGPIWAEVPIDCETLTLTRGRVSVTVTPLQGQTSFASQSAVLAALRRELSKRFNPMTVTAIMKVVGINGAWYPCDSDGCCRGA